MTTTLHDILWPKQNFIFSSTLFWWPPASSCLQLEKFGEMITLHNKHSNNVNKHHTVSDIMYFMKIMKTFTTTRANTILDYSNPRIWMNKFARYQILFSIEFFKVIWREGLFSFIFGQFFFLAYLMIFKVENEWWFCPMINMYIFDRIKKCHLGNQKKWKKKHFTKRDDVFSRKNVLILNDIQAEFSFLYPFEISTEPWKKERWLRQNRTSCFTKHFF